MVISGTEQINQHISSNTTQKRDRITDRETDQNQCTEVVEFRLATEYLAVDLQSVKEIVDYVGVTKLPNAPFHIRGIIDLRGEITTIIDPKKHLGIAESKDVNTDELKVIVLDEKKTGVKVGLLVDEVLAISAYAKDDIDTSMTTDATTYIKGIIKKVVHALNEDEQDRIELIIWVEVSRFVHEL